MRSLSFLFLLTIVNFGGVALGASDERQTLFVDGNEREYFVHLPPSYDGHTQLPLVLIFHGAIRNAQSMIRASELDGTADHDGFIAVYPQGLPLLGSLSRKHRYWNSNRTVFTRDSDDVRFTETLIDTLIARYAIDSARIFATGISNGAQLVYRLACEPGSRLAAVASVSGSFEYDECTPSQPIPVMEFHGTADKVIPYDGGSLLGFRSVAQTLGYVLAVDGCPATPVSTDVPDRVQDGTHVVLHRYGPCDSGSEVELIEIEQGGHNWPGVPMTYPVILGETLLDPVLWAAESKLFGDVTLQISANDLIWDFFQRHPRP
jgi:polyhydroxybutyrate depolymerase